MGKARGFRFSRGIGFRVSLTFFVIALFVLCIGVGLGYFWAFRLLRSTIGKGNLKLAQTLASTIARKIDEEVEDIAVYTSDKEWINQIKKSNQKYEAMDDEAITRHFKETDKKWLLGLKENHPKDEYLDKEVSHEQESLVRKETTLVEIFITNRFGGLVAASGITTDFYQADESWWQKAYNHGKGGVFEGDIGYDESSRTMSMTIARSIIDPANHKVIGVCKGIMDLNSLFKPLNDFRIGETGHSVLVDSNANMLLRKGIEAGSEKFLENKIDFDNILKQKEKWAVLDRPHHHKEKVLVAFSLVGSSYLQKQGIKLRVFIDQDADEIFAPLNRLAGQGIAVSSILIILF